MSAPPQIVVFHVGIVVRDIEAVIDRYKRMFGIDRWHIREARPDVPQRIAYGGREGTGMAFELIQAGETGQMAEFLAEHGEGIQHVGFWAPDLLGSLQAAVDEGGRIVWGPFEQQGNTVVQVQMPEGAPPPRQAAYIDAGMGTFRFELIGPPQDQGLRTWLEDDYARIMPTPPWSEG
jgi:catechol 2,3-dioxygenase-like lactoylglutathione lyase family enzyme